MIRESTEDKRCVAGAPQRVAICHHHLFVCKIVVRGYWSVVL